MTHLSPEQQREATTRDGALQHLHSVRAEQTANLKQIADLYNHRGDVQLSPGEMEAVRALRAAGAAIDIRHHSALNAYRSL
jgi:hypothetical protein